MSEPRKEVERKASLTKVCVTMTTDEQYQYMLENGILTDCTFLVGPEEGETREFKAHRVYIARVNDVFAAMLLTSEMNEAKTGHVRVTDLSPNTFSQLLNSIYGKEPVMTSYQEAQELAFAADKYQMKVLLENCVTRMNALITAENVWAALETADLLRNQSLKKTCVQVLQRDTLRCITEPEFMQTSEENVALLLKQDEMNVDDEPSLVNIIVQWARHAARQRGLSGDDSGVRAVLEPRLLSLFRFLAMSHQQFMLGPGLASWLTDDEKSAISECLRSGDSGKLPQHLSSLIRKRKIVKMLKSASASTASKKTAEFFICKREITAATRSSYENLVTSSWKSCCKVIEGSHSLSCRCAHATLIFRVNSGCNWLGFACVSRYAEDTRSDSTSLSGKNRLYQENILAETFSFNHSLSKYYQKCKIGSTIYKKEAEFNSTILVFFERPITLVTDNWFAIEISFRHPVKENDDKELPIIQYPNPSRAGKVHTEAGGEFIFYTENQNQYYSSVYDGIIESLILSL